MKKFETANCSVEFSVEELCFKNLKTEKPKKEVVKSKSELFRSLYDLGMEICEIARECGSHYSFVYGVISSSREVREINKTSKSDEIRALVDQGKKPGEIAKILNSNYSFVFSVVKKYKATKGEEVAAQ
jgi:DNA invertase Pin-like site-specific DNA recombinase